jgi:hypothetical protein
LAFRGKVADLAACEGQAIEAVAFAARRARPPRHITPDLIVEQPDIVAGQGLRLSGRDGRRVNQAAPVRDRV